MLGLLVSRKWTLCNQLLTIPYRPNYVNVQSSITSYGLVASARLVLFFCVITYYSSHNYHYDYIQFSISFIGSSKSFYFVIKSMSSAVFSDFPFLNSLLMTSTMTDFIFYNILILIQDPL